jgi:hypothetical protein
MPDASQNVCSQTACAPLLQCTRTTVAASAAATCWAWYYGASPPTAPSQSHTMWLLPLSIYAGLAEDCHFKEAAGNQLASKTV